MKTASELSSFIGRFPDQLTLNERWSLVGVWIALEKYTPETLPVRRIEAIGESTVECVRMLQALGLDARNFEFMPVGTPW